MGILLLFATVSLLVGSITTAIALQRRAAQRRTRLSNDRVEQIAASFKRAAQRHSTS